MIYCNCGWCEHNSIQKDEKQKLGVCLSHTGECPKKVNLSENKEEL